MCKDLLASSRFPLLPDSSWVGDVELVVPPEDHQTKPRSRRYGVATTFINSHPSQATRSGNKSTTGVVHRSHSADRYPLQVVIQQVTAVMGVPMPRWAGRTSMRTARFYSLVARCRYACADHPPGRPSGEERRLGFPASKWAAPRLTSVSGLRMPGACVDSSGTRRERRRVTASSGRSTRPAMSQPSPSASAVSTASTMLHWTSR